MKRTELERLSIRTVLAIGFGVTLGLWLYADHALTQRIQTVQRNASEVTARYTRAQELLSTVRAHVLLSSVQVRDALLNPRARGLATYREQIEASNQIIATALADYEPVVGPTGEGAQINRLRQEVEQFHAMSMSVLADAAGAKPAAIGDLLNRYIAPRRQAALAISEEIQGLNRQSFIQQQYEMNEIHRVAEWQSRRRLGTAFIVGLVTLLLTMVYAGRLEGRLRRQMVRDARMARELQATAGKVIAAQDEERRTIARELRDEVGQALSAIRLELDIAQRAIGGGTPSADLLEEARAMTSGALQTVGNLSQLLHPAADDIGLPAAIDTSLRGLMSRHQIRGELHQMDLPERLPHEVELAAYRIVQEAITNVAKHSHAMRCQVRLTQLTDRLMIEIEDDGIGFIEDMDRPIVARGLGLFSVRERANRLGGTVNILSTPGQGTRVIVSLPDRAALA